MKFRDIEGWVDEVDLAKPEWLGSPENARIVMASGRYTNENGLRRDHRGPDLAATGKTEIYYARESPMEAVVSVRGSKEARANLEMKMGRLPGTLGSPMTP